VQSSGAIRIVNTAPGIFSVDSTGTGPARLECLSKFQVGDFYSAPPCSVSNSSMVSILEVFGTGWRNAPGMQVKINNMTMTAISSGARGINGEDQLNILIPQELIGVTDADLSVVVSGTATESNRTKVSFQSIPTTLVVFPDGGIQCARIENGHPDIYTNPPCAASSGSIVNLLIIKGVGWRSTSNVKVRFEELVLDPLFVGPSGSNPDLVDQINLLVTSQLAGRSGQLSVFIPGSTVESNRVSISFLPSP
jgi:hypothetical protein